MALWMLEEAAPGAPQGTPGAQGYGAQGYGASTHDDGGHHDDGHGAAGEISGQGSGNAVLLRDGSGQGIRRNAAASAEPGATGVTVAAPRPGPLPPLGTVVQAGAFGAVLGGATTGLVNTMRAHSGEISREEAVRETVQMAAQGAASMAIASVAAHVVRVHPTFGLVTLLGVGVAALAMSRRHKTKRRKAVEPAFVDARAASSTPGKARSTTTRPPAGA